MPRYFFHIHDGVDIPDLVGTELAGLTEARREAITTAGATIHDLGQSFWIGDLWQMKVTDDAGIVLFELNFSGTLTSDVGTIPPSEPIV